MDILNEVYYVENGKLLGYHGKSRKLIIPEGITKIGSSVFSGSNLEKIIIPEYVEEVCEKAFENTKIESLYIAEGVKKIDENAFRNCLRLKEITIPSTIVPIFNSLQIFGESPSVEVIHIEKINSKILFFIEEKAFPNLKKIILGFNNSEVYVNKLKSKLSNNVKITFEDDWRLTDDKEIDDLLETLRNKVNEIYPEYMKDIFKEEVEKLVKMSLSNQDYERTSRVLINKLQNIIFKFNDSKVLVPIVNKIQKIVSIMDQELFEMSRMTKGVVDKASYIHYMALKYNDIETSKNLENILKSVTLDIVQCFLYLKVDLSNYVFTEEKKLDVEVSKLYHSVNEMYSNTLVSEYVDLIEEIRGESKKADSVFIVFNQYLKKYVKQELSTRKRKKFIDSNFEDISKTFDRLSYYERFIAGEIKSIVHGEITRYPDCYTLRYDLIKDFNNRDDIFNAFYEEYLIYDGIKPYAKLINTIRKYKGQKEPFGFIYDYDEEIFNLLISVSLLTDSLSQDEKYILDNLIIEYEDRLNDAVNKVPKDSKYLTNDANLYIINTNAEEMSQGLVSELSVIIEQLGNGLLNVKSNSIDKIVNKAIHIVEGKDEKGTTFLSRVEIKTQTVLEAINSIQENDIANNLKNKLVNALKDSKIKAKKEKEPETYVLGEINKIKDLVGEYKDTLEHFEEVKNRINSKEAL